MPLPRTSAEARSRSSKSKTLGLDPQKMSFLIGASLLGQTAAAAATASTGSPTALSLGWISTSKDLAPEASKDLVLLPPFLLQRTQRSNMMTNRPTTDPMTMPAVAPPESLRFELEPLFSCDGEPGGSPGGEASPGFRG